MSHSRIAIVVDDDPMVLEVLGSMLEHFGWLVRTASSAEDALTLGTLPAPRILITDVNLGSGMDGFDLCAVARRRWPDVGVVLISGRPPRYRQLQTLGSREMFLFKPVTMSALGAAIAHVHCEACDKP